MLLLPVSRHAPGRRSHERATAERIIRDRVNSSVRQRRAPSHVAGIEDQSPQLSPDPAAHVYETGIVCSVRNSADVWPGFIRRGRRSACLVERAKGRAQVRDARAGRLRIVRRIGSGRRDRPSDRLRGCVHGEPRARSYLRRRWSVGDDTRPRRGRCAAALHASVGSKPPARNTSLDETGSERPLERLAFQSPEFLGAG
jgi:hypothetical protein